MCQICSKEFTFTFRRHHCRACGRVSIVIYYYTFFPTAYFLLPFCLVIVRSFNTSFSLCLFCPLYVLSSIIYFDYSCPQVVCGNCSPFKAYLAYMNKEERICSLCNHHQKKQHCEFGLVPTNMHAYVYYNAHKHSETTTVGSSKDTQTHMYMYM